MCKTGRGNEVMRELRAGSTQLQRGGGRVVALRKEKSWKHTHHHWHAAGRQVEDTNTERQTAGNNRRSQRVEDMRERNKKHNKGMKNKNISWSRRLGEFHQYLCLSGGLSVAFLHLDPGVGVGLRGGGVSVWEWLLAAGAGFSRVLRLRGLRRSLLHRRGSWKARNVTHSRQPSARL